MAQFPALPLFTDAYLGDTRHLTAAQHGAYLLLLMTAWRTADCALPNNDDDLAKWAAMDRRTWDRNKSKVMAFWKLGDDGYWKQPRLSDERKYVADVSSRNASSGRASALKRKERHSTSVPTKRQPNFNPHTHTLSKERKITPLPPLPDWVPIRDWDDFIAMRKGMRKPMTARAVSLIIGELAKLRDGGNDTGAVLRQSIMNSWQGVFPIPTARNAAVAPSRMAIL